MDGVIRRNKTMLGLSIIALVLYVFHIVSRFLIGTLDLDWEEGMLYDSILGAFAFALLLIGYVVIYVLWTPDNEGNIRKRPTWQFVTLITALMLSIIGGILFSVNNASWFTFKVSYSQTGYVCFPLTNLLKPLIVVMVCILLIKSERKAKKILIVDLCIAALWLLSIITNGIIFSNYEARQLLRYYIAIDYILGYSLRILLLLFTVIYTKQKYKEASLLEEQRGL